MKKSLLLLASFIAISPLYAEIPQTTNDLAISTAVAIKFPTQDGKAYMIEGSVDLSTWTPASENWILGNDLTNTWFTETSEDNKFFRHQSVDRPTVIETFPENGSTNIDHTISQLMVRFSEDMQNGGTWGSSRSDGEPPVWLPGTERPDDRTVIRNILLETNTQYAIWINTPRGGLTFKSEAGISSMPYLLTFKTK